MFPGKKAAQVDDWLMHCNVSFLDAGGYASKMRPLRASIENEVVLVPLGGQQITPDMCVGRVEGPNPWLRARLSQVTETPRRYEQHMRHHAVVFGARRADGTTRAVACGFFAGAALWCNSLDPGVRFVGRADNIVAGINNNELVAAVHVVTTLHLKGEEAPLLACPALPLPIGAATLSVAVQDLRAALQSPDSPDNAYAGAFVDLLKHVLVKRPDVVNLAAETLRINTLTAFINFLHRPVTLNPTFELPATWRAQDSRNFTSKGGTKADRRLRALLVKAAAALRSRSAHMEPYYALLSQMHAQVYPQEPTSPRH